MGDLISVSVRDLRLKYGWNYTAAYDRINSAPISIPVSAPFKCWLAFLNAFRIATLAIIKSCLSHIHLVGFTIQIAPQKACCARLAAVKVMLTCATYCWRKDNMATLCDSDCEHNNWLSYETEHIQSLSHGEKEKAVQGARLCQDKSFESNTEQ